MQCYVCFSLSEEEGENIDALDIKPPQARVSSQSRSKRRDGRDHERSRHKRSDRHRDERHSHREKHHRYIFYIFYIVI